MLRKRVWRELKLHANTSLELGRFISKRHITHQTKTPLAFAFDIDGVLLQGSSVLPAAKRALSILEGNNSRKLKIPYILITNGGGSSEEDRCRKLTSQLGVEIRTTQLVQAHTILRTVAQKCPDDTVLVLGGLQDRVRKVAEGYGFRSVYTPSDVLAWNPSIWPFYKLSQDELSYTKKADFSRTPIASIFVFHDPRNWALDIQIMIDVLRSRTRCPGGKYRSQGVGAADDAPPVELVFCNPDLLWRGAFEKPRLGQGAFFQAFQSVFKAVTGETYPYTQYGKPYKATYQFAETILKERMAALEGRRMHDIKLPNIYMVGDNPASDIAGANAAKWSSVLVRTGVYDPAQGPPAHTPTREAEDVEEAVRWALKREGVEV